MDTTNKHVPRDTSSQDAFLARLSQSKSAVAVGDAVVSHDRTTEHRVANYAAVIDRIIERSAAAAARKKAAEKVRHTNNATLWHNCSGTQKGAPLSRPLSTILPAGC
jgi:hypothetical protein